jgi:PKD repeat protein
MILGMPRRLLLILILLAALVPVASCSVTEIEVEPAYPVQGDTVTLRIQASPGEKVPITISFMKALAVSDGEYDLPLNGVSVPQTPNSFTVRVEGVLNLNVAVKVLFWITKSVDASDGVATVSQGGVPPGVYTARIYGQAAPGVTDVNVNVTASTTVTMGPDGRYIYSYDTRAIPAGDFTARMGDVTRSITLKPIGGQDVVVNQKPLVAASFKAQVARGEDVLFDGSGSYDADGVVVGWEWSFGDGIKGVGMQTWHMYSKAETYAVSLAVTDNRGAVSTSTWTIVVEEPVNKAPSAVAGSDRTVFVGGRVDLSGEASNDPDGVITVYRWDLGDGSTADGVRVSHVYEKSGTYTVRLVVEDDREATAEDEATIWVMNPPVEPSLLPYVTGGILALAAVTILVLLRRRLVGGTQSPPLLLAVS